MYVYIYMYVCIYIYIYIYIHICMYITVDNNDRFPFLTLYTVVLVFIFSTLFYLQFLWF